MALPLTRLDHPFRPPNFSPFRRKPTFPIIHRRPIWVLPELSPKPAATRLTVRAQQQPVRIEGVSEELNSVASRNLDFAYTRRQVRLAFSEVQQQLDHYLFKVSAGIRTEEWYEKNSKGLEIFCKSWLPRQDVEMKGVVFFCHGYGDTCTFFFEGIAKQIAASGYGVFAIDHPGFGLSDGLHGYIPRFDDLIDNVIENYTKIQGRAELKGLPRFLLGQSMGGAVAIKTHLKAPHLWDGVILVAPMCKIAEEVTPPAAAVKLLTVASKILPKAKIVPQTDLAELAFRDATKRKLAVYNVICYNDTIRVRTAVELLKATIDIERRVDKVNAPLLILHGAADKVTDPEVSKFLFEKASSKDKTLQLYEGGYHCILEGEPDDRIFQVLEDIISWLDSHSKLPA